jgi:hypothetical protein
MKYNCCYRKRSTVNCESVALGPCPIDIDPYPATVAGARSLVERYYALKRLGVAASTMEEGAGGYGGRVGVTTPFSLGPLKTKSHSHIWHS